MPLLWSLVVCALVIYKYVAPPGLGRARSPLQILSYLPELLGEEKASRGGRS